MNYRNLYYVLLWFSVFAVDNATPKNMSIIREYSKFEYAFCVIYYCFVFFIITEMRHSVLPPFLLSFYKFKIQYNTYKMYMFNIL